MSTTVTYKGQTLTSVDNQTRTLETAGTYLEDDITLVDTTPVLQAKTNIAPTTSSQTITPDVGYDGLSSVQINAMPSGSATAPATIRGSGATLTTSDPNTLTLSKTVQVTPDVTPGYVPSGTTGDSDVELSAFVQLVGATTYTPTTVDQTIASGKYLTGAQTILGDANLVAWNIKDGVTIFGVTGTYSGGTNVNTIKGKAPLTFNAAASSVSALTQYGLVENIGTPSPTSPAPIKCNKGTMSVSNDTPSFTGNTGSITLGGNTLTTATLLGIGNKQDAHNILTGAVTHYIKYKVLTGSETFTSSPIASTVPALRMNTGGTWRVDASYAPVCSHFVGCTTKDAAALVENSCCWQSTSYLFFRTNESAADFKTWLTAQYNNGTPVVLFYVSTQTTTETLSAQSASTVAGSNTLAIDAEVYGETEITYNIS